MTTNIPVACTLTADELQERGQEISGLFDHVTEVKELADGYAFAFPGGDDQARVLLDFIVAERACCQFFTFDLQFPAPHEAIWLQVRGETAEVKEIIHATFAAQAVNGDSLTTAAR